MNFSTVHALNVPTWNPWNEDGTPASGFGTGDGNPDYYRDKLTSENSTNKSTYSVGFALDILPKKLVLNGNASLYRYDWQREKFNKSYQAQSSATPDIHARLRLMFRNTIKFS